MSKKFREELQAMSTEQVTEKLADFCENQRRILEDQNKSLVGAMFNAVANNFLSHRKDLVEVAAEKYFGNTANTADTRIKTRMENIAAAAVISGYRPSAEKIFAYILLTEAIEKKAIEMGSDDLPCDTLAQNVRASIHGARLFAKARRSVINN